MTWKLLEHAGREEVLQSKKFRVLRKRPIRSRNMLQGPGITHVDDGTGHQTVDTSSRGASAPMGPGGGVAAFDTAPLPPTSSTGSAAGGAQPPQPYFDTPEQHRPSQISSKKRRTLGSGAGCGSASTGVAGGPMLGGGAAAGDSSAIGRAEGGGGGDVASTDEEGLEALRTYAQGAKQELKAGRDSAGGALDMQDAVPTSSPFGENLSHQAESAGRRPGSLNEALLASEGGDGSSNQAAVASNGGRTGLSSPSQVPTPRLPAATSVYTEVRQEINYTETLTQTKSNKYRQQAQLSYSRLFLQRWGGSGTCGTPACSRHNHGLLRAFFDGVDGSCIMSVSICSFVAHFLALLLRFSCNHVETVTIYGTIEARQVGASKRPE